MKIYFAILFLLITNSLIGQSSTTVLQKLKEEKTIKLEWVHQQYLPDSGSVAGNYPLYPDQMKEGEGEVFVGLKLELANDGMDSYRIKVWVEYVSFVQLPQRRAGGIPANVYALGGTPPNALLYPIIEDTRYAYSDSKESSFSLSSMDSIPILVDVEKGLIERTWQIAVDDQGNKLPSGFSYHHLQTFLHSLWQAEWLDKEHFHLVYQEEQFDKISAYFFRPIYPPKATVITGKIHHPTIDTFNIDDFKEGSLRKTFGSDEIILDSLGSFEISTILDHPRELILTYGFNALQLYIEPGDSLHIEIDANAFYRKTTFSGDQVIANQFLLDFFHELRGDKVWKTLDKNLLQWSQLEYVKIIQEKEKIELDFLNSRRAILHPTFYSYMERSIRLNYAEDLWNEAIWFYNKRDAHYHPQLFEYAQGLSKYFFRLPNDDTYDFVLGQYLDFQKSVLKGRYTNQKMQFKTFSDFDLAKVLFSPKNTFRVGRLILFLNEESSDLFNNFYNEVKEICKDPIELEYLTDYENPDTSFESPKGWRNLQEGKTAPKWKFIDHAKDTIQLSDYFGKYLLLHIGLKDYLPQVIQDIEEIQATTSTEFSIVSIISDPYSLDVDFKSRKFVHYIPFKEMQELRDNYLISDRANHYFLIDPEGKVLSNSFYTSSFQKLQTTVGKLPVIKEKKGWTPPAVFWRNIGLLSLLLLLTSLGYIQRKRMISKRELQKRQLLELELKGIRSQMNPHFLFNALSSIQNLIRKKDAVGADRYLTQFAGLVRKILQNSEQEFITLAEELAAIKEYCSLEALRTPFDYQIEVSKEIDTYNTYIPGMLLQPLIENAIVHGLATKSTNRNIWVSITKKGTDLACEIKDNGIGIKQAGLQTKDTAHKKSFGLSLVKQRLKLLLNQSEKDFLKIIDKSELDATSTGTIVQLTIPTEK